MQEPTNNLVHYQPLHIDTRDYISMYSTTTVAGRRGGPSMEMEKLYSIVDSTKREEYVYPNPQQVNNATNEEVFLANPVS